MVPVIDRVLVVLLPTVLLVMVARPPRLVPLTRMVPFFFHTEVNGALPASVVVNVAVVPWTTCWFVIGVVTTGGTQRLAVSVLVLTVAKFVPETAPVFATEDALAGLVSGLLTVTWNLTITLLPTGSVPMLTLTGGTKNIAAADITLCGLALWSDAGMRVVRLLLRLYTAYRARGEESCALSPDKLWPGSC